MDEKILVYLALLRDFGRIYTQKILSGNTGQKNDIKLSQIKAMYAFRDADSRSAQEFADLVGTKLCTATFMADSLEREGIVTRKRDPADRRKVMVTLTPQGKRLRKDFLAHRHRIARKIFAHTSSADQLRLQKALATVCEILQQAFVEEKQGSGRLKKSSPRHAEKPAAKSRKTAPKPVAAKG
jgi:DNA-binding MarR family transcriptional regulator